MIPWLIQRIDRRRDVEDSVYHTGIDRHFGFDYMGSAEFEFGTLPAALKRMRASSPDLIGFQVGANQFWFVGSPEDFSVAKAVFEDQLGKREMHFKECTFIRESVDPKEKYLKMLGWWAVDERLTPWAVFLKQEDAAIWMREAYRPKETKETEESTE